MQLIQTAYASAREGSRELPLGGRGAPDDRARKRRKRRQWVGVVAWLENRGTRTEAKAQFAINYWHKRRWRFAPGRSGS